MHPGTLHRRKIQTTTLPRDGANPGLPGEPEGGNVNRYETVCIVRPDVAEDVIKGIIQKATSSLEGAGATVTKVDEWGRRKLAYPIQKKSDGYYFVLDYNSSPEASKEVERILGLNEDVLRQQTVRIITTRKMEKAKADAEARAAKAKAKAEAKAGAAAKAEGGQA